MKLQIKTSEQKKEFTIKPGDKLIIGRNPHADFVCSSSKVSFTHSALYLNGANLVIKDLESTNGSYVNGNKLQKEMEFFLMDNDNVKLADIHLEIKILKEDASNPSDNFKNRKTVSALSSLTSSKDGEMIIGRGDGCDIKLVHPSVSRKHALISREKGEFYITDLNSTNGTRINGRTLLPNQKIRVDKQDEIMFGLQTFNIAEERPNLSDRKFVIIEAIDIEKIYPQKVGLNKMSLRIHSGEFVALMGPSGCGKSTLLKVLNNVDPATSGKVLVGNMDLKKNFEAIKRNIGYVPQDDIVHKELTIDQTMFYAAKLRMPSHTSDDEMKKRIEEVLNDLNISSLDLRNMKVGKLSGGQRKRVAIAVEMLNNPSILFLDEPTSPLDPEVISEFLEAIRNLCREKNITVIMVTHKPDDLEYVDSIVFLGSGGYHTFTGIKKDLLSFFNTTNIIKVYSLLKKKEQSKEMNKKWIALSSFSASPTKEAKLAPHSEKENPFEQFFWLTRRALSIKFSDYSNLFVPLVLTLGIGLIILFVFNHLQIQVLFMMVITTIFLGLFNSIKEIVNELPILKRERMLNMSIINYYASKLAVMGIIMSFQVFIFLGLIYIKFANGVKVWLQDFGAMFKFLFFLSMSAVVLGLLISAISKNIERVLNILLFTLVLQMVFAGTTAKVDNDNTELLSFMHYSRWGMQGVGYIQDDNFENSTEGSGVMQIGLWNPFNEKMPPKVRMSEDKRKGSLAKNKPTVFIDTLFMEPNIDSSKLNKADTIRKAVLKDILKFDNEERILKRNLNMFTGLNGTYLAISILNLLFMLLTLFKLNRLK
jgi:ABC-type multidrug transport system ATPase subunit/pSer/pThr/pTyr-binding forkhead associated (FHA) protein/ABC-type multidrug transport system permease subunit